MTEDKIGERRPMDRSEVQMVIEYLGIGAFILNLHLVDYSRGSMRRDLHSRCFWLTDGRRIDISMSGDRGVIGSVTHEPDPDIPEPLPGG